MNPIVFLLSLFSTILIIPVMNAQEYEFPEAWIGNWTGDLLIYSNGQYNYSIPMEIEISDEEDGSGNFYITYGGGDQVQTRLYEWYELDSAKGHYVIDEQNGIKLHAFVLGNCLMEKFDVMESSLITRFCIEDSEMYFESVFTGIEATWETGDTIIQADTIPPVQSYRIPSFQKATLNKVDY